MRADALANKEKLRVAAAAAYGERGLTVPVKEIARRAGLSHGTLYNLFGTREALIDDVIGDIAAQKLEAVGVTALELASPWEGFTYYVETLCGLMATDPVISDVVRRAVPKATRIAEICDRCHTMGSLVINRAKNEGSLRADFQETDVIFIFGAYASLARALENTASGSWRRGIALILDGLRATAAQPLPVPELTRQQLFEVNSALG
ncbi:TetR family transcriptional regulator [Arthrobacter sp. RIT-PI-e]|uniref:TetR/AcrR family transcriptional regulator n=1 Tax=Arthrobacter sp. RIT-PI-e TaxID=1681197 RepID=UPI0006764905|nr:TetR/AcrR family transcriptional regulator [Arthrobacter sp. RIT-PI-e]KNC18842.1 TetR family transcriptional regulator [Arthrobacter sp. RIT-PI-e]